MEQKKSSEGKKQKFVCSACGYRFARLFRPNMCPFCGKATVEVDKSKGAEDLLREIEDMEQEIKSRRDDE